MSGALKDLATGLLFPEGPVALGDGAVLLVEIGRRQILRVEQDGRTSVVATLRGAPNGLALGPDGALYICNNGAGFGFDTVDGIYQPVRAGEDYCGGSIDRLDLSTGALTTLYREVEGRPLLMPNDLVFDRQGGFYFSDHGFRHERSLDYGGLYYGRADGSLVQEVVFPLTTANGVGLSPDERTVYVAETETCRVLAYSIVEPGIVRKPPHHEPGQALLAQLDGLCRCDSMAVEANGNLCIAGLTPGCITVLAPDGRLVERVAMPDPFSTNLCFGGPDGRTAFITLSGSGRLVSMPWPRPGLPLNFSR